MVYHLELCGAITVGKQPKQGFKLTLLTALNIVQ